MLHQAFILYTVYLFLSSLLFFWISLAKLGSLTTLCPNFMDSCCKTSRFEALLLFSAVKMHGAFPDRPSAPCQWKSVCKASQERNMHIGSLLKTNFVGCLFYGSFALQWNMNLFEESWVLWTLSKDWMVWNVTISLYAIFILNIYI